MEATGVYWEACALWFHQHGYQVSVVNPARGAAFVRSEFRGSKIGSLDAVLLTRFGLRMPPAFWQPPEREMEAIHQLMRQRDAYVQSRTQLQNQVHALTYHVHPCQDAVDSLRRSLEAMVVEITALETAVKHHLAAHPEWHSMLDRLMTMIGVSFVIAATILTETHGIHGFQNSVQLCEYAGIAPVLCRSGTSVHKRDHLSKIGNPRLREAAYRVAVVAVRFCPSLQTVSQRLLDRQKPKKVALVAVAQKILRIAFTLLTQGNDFDPDYLSQNMNKLP